MCRTLWNVTWIAAAAQRRTLLEPSSGLGHRLEKVGAVKFKFELGLYCCAGRAFFLFSKGIEGMTDREATDFD